MTQFTVTHTFPVSVDYDKTIEAALQECALRSADHNVKSSEFPPKRRGQSKVEIHLVRFDSLADKEAKDRLKEGMRDLAKLDPQMNRELEEALEKIDRMVDVDLVAGELEKARMRPAELRELLAFTAQHKPTIMEEVRNLIKANGMSLHVQKRIYALESRRVTLGGDEETPYLEVSGHVIEGRITMHEFSENNYEDSDQCYFAAVKI